jgi:hypothetical protein
MAINIRCETTSFNCRYRFWKEIRLNIINQTFQFLKSKIEEDLKEFSNHAASKPEYIYYMKIINNK